MTPRTSDFEASNELRGVTCYDNLKLYEIVIIHSICMAYPTLGPIMSLVSFSQFAPVPLVCPKCLHQCPYFVLKAVAIVQNKNRGKTNS